MSFSSERLSEFHQLVSWLVSQGAGHCQPYVNPRITLVLGLEARCTWPVQALDGRNNMPTKDEEAMALAQKHYELE
ncbi:MAG: hypothetical protein ACLQIB_26265, partial [Isosphaeraceae bacterium]